MDDVLEQLNRYSNDSKPPEPWLKLEESCECPDVSLYLKRKMKRKEEKRRKVVLVCVLATTFAAWLYVNLQIK
jgi:hypothetical protein